MQVVSALNEYLETDTTIFEMMLVSIVPYLPKIKKAAPDYLTKELLVF
jgi:hypothetical protein